jgi:hypothetical protein
MDGGETFQSLLNVGGLGRDSVFVFRYDSKSIVVSGWNPLHISRLLTTGKGPGMFVLFLESAILLDPGNAVSLWQPSVFSMCKFNGEMYNLHYHSQGRCVT